jgi:hypothetical protein
MDVLRGASAEEKAELRKLLQGESHTSPIATPSGSAAQTKMKKPAEMPVPPLPEGSTQPDASAYRLRPEQIVEDVCMARLIPHKDARWSIKILAESQCGAVCVEGEDLCKVCLRREERYLADPKPGPWHGRLRSRRPSRCCILGTAWAESRLASGKLKWMPAAVSVPLLPAGGAGDASSETASTVSTPSVAQMKAALRAEAEKAAKIMEMEVKKVKKAEKALEMESKKAAKEAEKATKLLEKAAAKKKSE